MWLYYTVMHPKDADGIANSVDPDQTAPLGAVWSGYALFAKTCPSENLGSLRYSKLTNLHDYRLFLLYNLYRSISLTYIACLIFSTMPCCKLWSNDCHVLFPRNCSFCKVDYTLFDTDRCLYVSMNESSDLYNMHLTNLASAQYITCF